MSEQMIALESLSNVSRPSKRRKLLGRGTGCKRGKTCGRGHKGDGSRSGWKLRRGYDGGGVPLHRRVPTRGFSNARFKRVFDVVNLGALNNHFDDGEKVNLESLYVRGFLTPHSHGVKILGEGNLTKKITIDLDEVEISQGALSKIKAQGSC